jgi:L-asparaginase II
MPLRGLATAYARLGARAATGEEGPAAVVEAVRRHPFMLSGTGQLDTILIEATGGRILAKVGAEATYAAVDLSTGTALALKVLDGAPRARAAALLAAVRALDWLDEDQWQAVLPAASVDIHGGGQTVGAVRPAKLDLTVAE